MEWLLDHCSATPGAFLLVKGGSTCISGSKTEGVSQPDACLPSLQTRLLRCCSHPMGSP